MAKMNLWGSNSTSNIYNSMLNDKNKPSGYYPQKPTTNNNTSFNTGSKPSGGSLPSKQEWENTLPKENPNTGVSSGSTSSVGGSYYNPYASILEEQRRRLQEQQNQQINGVNKAYESLLDNLDSSFNFGRDTLNQSADKALAESYVANEMAKRALPQQMAAYGNTGGLTESSMMQQRAGYENRRYGINDSKAAKLAELLQSKQANEAQALQDKENAIINIRNNVGNELSNLESNYATNLADMQVAAQKAEIAKQEKADKEQQTIIRAQEEAARNSPGYLLAAGIIQNNGTAQDAENELKKVGYTPQQIDWYFSLMGL